VFAYFGADLFIYFKGKERRKTEQKLWLKQSNLYSFVMFLSPNLENVLCVSWEECVLRFGSLRAEQGWSVVVK
jgi:hypothetical protein